MRGTRFSFVLSAFFRGYLSGFCGYSLGDFASLADEALAKSALREIFFRSASWHAFRKRSRNFAILAKLLVILAVLKGRPL